MSSPETTSLPAALGRLVWMLLGPMVLVLATFSVVRRGGGWLTPPDLVFFAVLAVMVLGRWLEFHGGNPMTAEGKPASPAHLQRYALGAAIVGLTVWVVANLVGNYPPPN